MHSCHLSPGDISPRRDPRPLPRAAPEPWGVGTPRFYPRLFLNSHQHLLKSTPSLDHPSWWCMQAPERAPRGHVRTPACLSVGVPSPCLLVPHRLFTSPGIASSLPWGSDLTFAWLTLSLGPASLLSCADGECLANIPPLSPWGRVPVQLALGLAQVGPEDAGPGPFPTAARGLGTQQAVSVHPETSLQPRGESGHTD